MSQINEIIVGVDVAKDKLDIYFHPIGTHAIIANEVSSIKRFFLKVKRECAIKMIVLESTGGHEKACVKTVAKMGLPIHVAHPNLVHHFGKSEKFLAKTDKVDAKILALFAQEKNVEPSVLKSESDQQLQDLMRRKQQLTDFLAKEKLRLSHDSLGKLAKNSLKRFIKQIERELDLLDKELRKGIAKDAQKQEQVERLKTYKGVGENTAMMLAVCVPELGQLNRAEIAALIGVAPINQDSGTKKGYRAIQGGRFYVRKMLYMVALSAIRFNPAIKTFYERLKAKGKQSKVAITAVMRKIIVTLNAMLRDKQAFSLEHGKKNETLAACSESIAPSQS